MDFFFPVCAALAEVGDSLGTPGLSLLSGLRDGPGRNGLVQDAGDQSL